MEDMVKVKEYDQGQIIALSIQMKWNTKQCQGLISWIFKQKSQLYVALIQTAVLEGKGALTFSHHGSVPDWLLLRRYSYSRDNSSQIPSQVPQEAIEWAEPA